MAAGTCFQVLELSRRWALDTQECRTHPPAQHDSVSSKSAADFHDAQTPASPSLLRLNLVEYISHIIPQSFSTSCNRCCQSWSGDKAGSCKQAISQEIVHAQVEEAKRRWRWGSSARVRRRTELQAELLAMDEEDKAAKALVESAIVALQEVKVQQMTSSSTLTLG